MSRTYPAKKNKQQTPKVHYEQYLYNANEPLEDLSNDSSSGLDVDVIDDTYDLKQQFRRLAIRIRNY